MSLRIGFLRIGHDRCGGCARICRCFVNCRCMELRKDADRWELVCNGCADKRMAVAA
jgi:hypothetical protein